MRDSVEFALRNEVRWLLSECLSLFCVLLCLHMNVHMHVCSMVNVRPLQM